MAQSDKLDLVIVTPERQVLAEKTDVVVVPAHDGELGVLPHRAPVVCELGVGELYYRSGGRTRRVFVDGGFAQVLDNAVTVLTHSATRQEDITADAVAQAEQAVAAAGTREERLRTRRRVAVLRRLRAG